VYRVTCRPSFLWNQNLQYTCVLASVLSFNKIARLLLTVLYIHDCFIIVKIQARVATNYLLCRIKTGKKRQNFVSRTFGSLLNLSVILNRRKPSPSSAENYEKLCYFFTAFAHLKAKRDIGTPEYCTFMCKKIHWNVRRSCFDIYIYTTVSRLKFHRT
jgi:hypothetical protein